MDIAFDFATANPTVASLLREQGNDIEADELDAINAELEAAEEAGEYTPRPDQAPAYHACYVENFGTGTYNDYLECCRSADDTNEGAGTMNTEYQINETETAVYCRHCAASSPLSGMWKRGNGETPDACEHCGYEPECPAE